MNDLDFKNWKDFLAVHKVSYTGSDISGFSGNFIQRIIGQTGNEKAINFSIIVKKEDNFPKIVIIEPVNLRTITLQITQNDPEIAFNNICSQIKPYI